MTKYWRFQGQLVLFDPHHQRDPRSMGEIDRAILRQGELVMDVSVEGERYSLSLVKSPDDVFRGSWARGNGSVHPEQGQAQCRLTPFSTSIGTPDPDGAHLQLEGTWSEDGVWRWFGRLDRVESFATA